MDGGRAEIRENKISFYYRRRIGQTSAAGNGWVRGRDAMHEEWRKGRRCIGREWTRAVIYWLAVLHAGGGLDEENQTPHTHPNHNLRTRKIYQHCTFRTPFQSGL